MKICSSILGFLCVVSGLLMGCQQKPSPPPDELSPPGMMTLFEPSNLVAWCVVPFDSVQRGPEARAAMLKELGFTKFAYDWRDQHLSSFPEEVMALKEQGIALLAVWWWIDGQGTELLNSSNRQLLQYLDSMDIGCDIWMSFDDRFFEGLDDSTKLLKAIDAVSYLHEKASAAGSSLQLYNHGAWFGDPRNQVRIIEQSGVSDLGIVYNFHHAHQQIQQFPELLAIMIPYLNTVNINGMREEGPKILEVGQGDREAEMLATLADAGFRGHIGIIGHLEDRDVREVLMGNLKGLEAIRKELNKN